MSGGGQAGGSQIRTLQKSGRDCGFRNITSRFVILLQVLLQILCSPCATGRKYFCVLDIGATSLNHNDHTNREARRPSLEVSRRSVTIVNFGQNVMQMECIPIGSLRKAKDEMRRWDRRGGIEEAGRARSTSSFR